ncbi:MAG TPA: tetratricopeptide repeat protein [Candidatus Obscuribacterales bacterium]
MNDEVLALRKSGAFHHCDDLSVIKISGTDAASFLQARLSNDVLALQPGDGQLTSLLDRKAHVLFCGSLHRLGDVYWLIVARSQCRDALKLLEEFKFRDRVAFEILDGAHFLSIDSTKCDLLLMRMLPKGARLEPREHSAVAAEVAGAQTTFIRRSNAGEPGLLVVSGYDSDGCTGGRQPAFDALVAEAKSLNLLEISTAAYDIACLEAGNLGLRLDGLLLPESGLEASMVSYTKGCFPGQEVLARIKTYGAPRRGVAGVVFEDNGSAQSELAPGATIQVNGEDVGTIHQSAYSPTLKKHIATVIIQREYRVPDQKVNITVNGAPYTVTVATMPFYCSAGKAAAAQELYDKALREFARGSEQEAISMLREVIDLNPTMADAYETLGVILNRHDQLDEAITLMKQLACLDANSIMAHANLSVFYMQKGDKEAAEEEKAIAMSIRMSELARSAAVEQQEQEQRQQLKAAAQERMSMFREVLAIDADDFLANAGLGSVYVDLEKYGEAVPYLQKALSKRPNHTVAYVALGEAFEKLGQTAEAVDTYKKGVVVAAQRGDGEPMKKMQIRLEKLAAEARG